MSIELGWYMPDKILISRWSGEPSLEDVQIMLEELAIILNKATDTLHMLLDVTTTSYMSMDFVHLYLRSDVHRHPRRGRIALVGWSAHSAALADFVNRASQSKMIQLFDSYTEAQEFLLRYDTPPERDFCNKPAAPHYY